MIFFCVKWPYLIVFDVVGWERERSLVPLCVLQVLPTKLASAFQSRAAITASPRPSSSFIPQVYKHRVVSWLTLRPLRIGQALGFFSSLRGFEHACRDARSSLLTSKCPKRAINLDTSLDNFFNLKIILPFDS